jgi:hypothetical protein
MLSRSGRESVRRGIALSLLVVLASSCGGAGGAAQSVACDVFGRGATGENLRGEQVTLELPRDEAVIDRPEATVKLTTLTEEGTNGSLVVAILDGQREMARGHYQFGDETRNQFRGGHGFTGLVTWRDPATGAEIQYFCNAE